MSMSMLVGSLSLLSAMPPWGFKRTGGGAWYFEESAWMFPFEVTQVTQCSQLLFLSAFATSEFSYCECGTTFVFCETRTCLTARNKQPTAP